jgi:DNA repair protein RecO (recombination protein O)
MIKKAEAIILSNKRFGDSSLIAVAYTKQKGKLSLIAKGGLRPKSRFASTLLPLSYITLQYYEKKSGLSTVSDAESATTFHSIHQSYDHLSIGLALLETVSLLSEDDEAEERLFAMLLRSIELLDQHIASPRNLFILFQFHFATLIGYKIDLKTIPGYDPDIEESDNYLAFYHEEGSPKHRGRTSGYNSFTFRTETFYILRTIVAAGFDNCGEVPVDDSEFNELVRFFKSYFSYHLEQKVEFRSLSLIDTTNGF